MRSNFIVDSGQVVGQCTSRVSQGMAQAVGVGLDAMVPVTRPVRQIESDPVPAQQMESESVESSLMFLLQPGRQDRPTLHPFGPEEFDAAMAALFDKTLAPWSGLSPDTQQGIRQIRSAELNAPKGGLAYARHRHRVSCDYIDGHQLQIIRSPDPTPPGPSSLFGSHVLKYNGLVRVKVLGNASGGLMIRYRPPDKKIVRPPGSDKNAVVTKPINRISWLKFGYYIDASPLFRDARNAPDGEFIKEQFGKILAHMPANRSVPIIATVVHDGHRITMASSTIGKPLLKMVHFYGQDNISIPATSIPADSYRVSRRMAASSMGSDPPRTTPDELCTQLQTLKDTLDGLGHDKAGYTAGFVTGLIQKAEQLSANGPSAPSAILGILPDWIVLMDRYLESLGGASLSTRDASDQFERFAACVWVCVHVMDAALSQPPAVSSQTPMMDEALSQPSAVSSQAPIEALKERVLTNLQVPSGVHATIQVANFGMSSWYQALRHVIGMWQSVVHSDSTCRHLTFSMPEKNYFELLFAEKGFPDWVTRCPSGPASVMVVSFVPNNVVASNAIFNMASLKEDITKQLEMHRSNHQLAQKKVPVVLIVDTSTQLLYPPELADVLTTFSQAIQNKELIVMQVVSMAKLLQLGLDRMSGGLLVTYSAPISPSEPAQTTGDVMLSKCHKPTKQPPPLSDQAARFFTFLLTHCKDDLTRYYQDVLGATQETYLRLRLLSSRNPMCVDVQLKDAGVPVIGLRIKPTLLPERLNTEFFIKVVWQYLLYRLREIHIDARQSIGLLHSHVNVCKDHIRLVVGAMSSPSDRLAIVNVLSHMTIPPRNAPFWNTCRRASDDKSLVFELDHPKYRQFPTGGDASLIDFWNAIMPAAYSVHDGDDRESDRPSDRSAGVKRKAAGWDDDGPGSSQRRRFDWPSDRSAGGKRNPSGCDDDGYGSSQRRRSDATVMGSAMASVGPGEGGRSSRLAPASIACGGQGGSYWRGDGRPRPTSDFGGHAPIDLRNSLSRQLAGPSRVSRGEERLMASATPVGKSGVSNLLDRGDCDREVGPVGWIDSGGGLPGGVHLGAGPYFCTSSMSSMDYDRHREHSGGS